MKKIMLTMLTGLMIVCFTSPVQGKGYDEYRSNDSRYYSKAGYKYYPRDGRGYYYKHERKILKKIRKNERRIMKLERKIRKLKRKRHYRGYYRYDYYTRRIRQLRYDIRRLERRNRYLRRQLNRYCRY